MGQMHNFLSKVTLNHKRAIYLIAANVNVCGELDNGDMCGHFIDSMYSVITHSSLS